MIKVKVKGEVGKRIKIRESLFPEYKGQVFTCIKRDKGQNWFIESGKDKLIVHEYDFMEEEL